MKILFQGIYLEKCFENELQSSTRNFPYAQQKFESMIIDGFKKNEYDFTILSTFPCLRWPNYKKIIVNLKSNESNHFYLKFINLPFFKQLSIIISQFIFIIKWCNRNRENKKIYLIYGTNPINCIMPLLLRKILDYKVVVIVSEINEYSYFDMSNILKKLKKTIYLKVSNWFSNCFDGYILLSQYMNEVINKNKKPYIIIEAICDGDINRKISYDNRNRSILYAGSLLKKYGIAKLVDAFVKCNIDSYTLDIYGNGDYVEEIERISKTYKQIKYHGTVSNEEIKEIEKKAYLLVNPRPSDEKITRYSFPSKTIEYMSSGTVCLITKLSGIPDEYFEYCYHFDSETVETMSIKLKEILNLDPDNLEEKAKEAFEFVNRTKNSKNQTKKIYDFLNKI